MKIPLDWLKDYTDVTVPPVELARRLTMAGFEVGEVQEIGGDWENVFVGQITGVNPHPNADRLRLATVDLGGEQETVVCGAPNLNVGDKIAFARVGARLLNPYTGQVEELKSAKIRGITSSGMICSEKELGISDSHEGILVLASEAVIGTSLKEHMGETILDLDVTANRPDCLSVVGIARETAALCGSKMHLPEVTCEETEESIDDKISIEIKSPDLCPRYCASLITGVTIKESPAWLQKRLIAGGQRPINNIVDITNYVMLEYGQPLHSFDYDRIAKRKIVVRRAQEGETFYTLDEVERKLSGNTLVIGDGDRTVAIAGVMGGLNSEVTENTTNILLEAASFNAASIHYTSGYLGLQSEASMRFARGISSELTIPALRHATQLIAELGGGKVAKGIADVYPGKKEAKPITLSIEKVSRVMGVEYTRDEIITSLESLGFECRPGDKTLKVFAPYWRSDIKQDVDLIEEVARICGYDRIPTTLLAVPIPRHYPEPTIDLREKIRYHLVGLGFQEVMTYTLTGLENLSKLTAEARPPEPLPGRVANPMTAEQEYLRPNLRANLLTTLASNRRFEDGGIMIFELGKIFQPRENDLPAEPEVLGGVINGPRVERSWLGGDGSFEFHDVKGIVESLLARLRLECVFAKTDDEGLHPARQAGIFIEDNGLKVKLGTIGELHPRVTDAFEIEGTVYLFELNVTMLLPFVTGVEMYQPVPRFPGTIRDMSLVVDSGVTHGAILDIINSYPLISEVKLFDVYTGRQVAEGKKSLAYRLVYQSPTHTLTDEEVTTVQEQLIDRLYSELGATLRG